MYFLSVFGAFHKSISGLRAMKPRYLFGSILNFHFCTKEIQKVNTTTKKIKVQIRSDSSFSNIFKDLNRQMLLHNYEREEFSQLLTYLVKFFQFNFLS